MFSFIYQETYEAGRKRLLAKAICTLPLGILLLFVIGVETLLIAQNNSCSVDDNGVYIGTCECTDICSNSFQFIIGLTVLQMALFALFWTLECNVIALVTTISIIFYALQLCMIVIQLCFFVIPDRSAMTAGDSTDDYLLAATVSMILGWVIVVVGGLIFTIGSIALIIKRVTRSTTELNEENQFL